MSEQLDEFEALESIFGDAFTVTSKKSPLSFKILLTPYSAMETDKENHVSINLICKFPKAYPEIVPELNIEAVKGLSPPQVEEITEIARNSAAELLGTPCIYEVTELIKTWLIENNLPGQDGSMYADMMRRMQQKGKEDKKTAKKDSQKLISESVGCEDFAQDLAVDVEEQERLRKRAMGTSVTPESFAIWKKKFNTEMNWQSHDCTPNTQPVPSSSKAPKAVFNFALDALPIAMDVAEGSTEGVKPTGKQLFLMNKAMINFAYLDENDELLEAAFDKALESLSQEEGQVEDSNDEDDSDYEEGDEAESSFEEDA